MRQGHSQYIYPDEAYQVKNLHVGNEVKIKSKSSIPRQYWNVRGTIVFINRAFTQQIKVILQERWMLYGMITKKLSAWFSEEDLIKL